GHTLLQVVTRFAIVALRVDGVGAGYDARAVGDLCALYAGAAVPVVAHLALGALRVARAGAEYRDHTVGHRRACGADVSHTEPALLQVVTRVTRVALRIVGGGACHHAGAVIHRRARNANADGTAVVQVVARLALRALRI